MAGLDAAQGDDPAAARGRALRQGMPPGLDNPLGARTLYLYQNGAYTLYTIYSTIMPETIGRVWSSGCVGLLTQDMVDLYEKTPVNTKVIVLPARRPGAMAP
jgi:lipoprotein-anchoring transpeptidase ErfK/SrfK